MESALLAFVAILTIGALLGIVAFWKVRKLAGLTGQVNQLQAEIGALRTMLADRSKLSPGPDEGPPKTQGEIEADAKPASKVDEPDIAPAEQVRPKSTPGTGPSRHLPSAATIAAAAKGQPSAADAAKKSLENTIGALWAVWVGGVALALGAIFLVRYSLEQGWLGPLARVAFGLAFGAILIALGEWTRRRGQAFSFPGFERANVPAILTASGTVAAFAALYAAYELYGLISPALAFVCLGVIAVAGLAAALLHGVLLATVGLLGSYCVPLLVSTNEPKPLALALYILIVSAAAFGVARLKLWRWLAISAVCGLVLWGVALLTVTGHSERTILFGYVIAAWAMVCFVFVVSLYQRMPKRFVRIDIVATAALSSVLLLLLGAILFQTHDALTTMMLVCSLVACFGTAYFYAAARYGILAAIAIVVPGYLGWSISLDDAMLFTDSVGSSHGVSTPMLEEIRRQSDTVFVWTGLVLASIAAALGLFGTVRSASRALQAIGGAGLPILLLAVAYVRMEMFQPSVLFGGLALALGFVLGIVADRLYFQLEKSEPARDEAISAWAVASIAAIALALAFTLEHGALTVALALVVPATAMVHARRPLRALRPVAVVIALLWVARIVWDPRITGGDLGTVPVFNWLSYGYGVPTAGFALSCWLFGQDRRDVWLEILEAITIAALAATLGLVGLHALDPAALFTPIDSVAEAAILSLVSGGIALGLLRMGRTRSSRSLDGAANVLGYAGMAMSAFWLLVFWNPMLTGERIDPGIFFNRLTFSYLLPSGLYALLALASRKNRPPLYFRAAAALGFALSATWVTLSIRHAFHPVDLWAGETGNGELYTYSAVWLFIGIVVLVAGILSGLRPVRLLSGAILIGVVAKVFLIDMANLTGVLRALSFIGLGIVLIGIGLVYQRLLRTPQPEAGKPETGTPPDAAQGAPPTP